VTFRSHRDGFTLIEMLVLIIIMAVLSSVAVPAYSRFRAATAFDVRVGELVGFLSSARALAIETGSDVRVTFDAQSDTFQMEARSGEAVDDRPTAMTDVAENGPAPARMTFAFDGTFAVANFEVFGPELATDPKASESQTTVVFHDDGTSDGVRFDIFHVMGRAVTVTVWAGTALPEVTPYGEG